MTAASFRRPGVTWTKSSQKRKLLGDDNLGATTSSRLAGDAMGCYARARGDLAKTHPARDGRSTTGVLIGV
jgi:hypothetical protein